MTPCPFLSDTHQVRHHGRTRSNQKKRRLGKANRISDSHYHCVVNAWALSKWTGVQWQLDSMVLWNEKKRGNYADLPINHSQQQREWWVNYGIWRFLQWFLTDAKFREREPFSKFRFQFGKQVGTLQVPYATFVLGVLYIPGTVVQ